jgi:TetR/AcrR family transcriptional regulator of autoinduction and epiphytic fitness
MATERRAVRGDADERRQQIMRAAERLFARRRVHEVTLDDVARIARVGKGTIYRYFADKDDLFFQTATSGFDDLCALLQRRVPDGADFNDRLLGACQQVLAFFERRRHLIRMMQAEEGHALQSPGRLRERWLARRQNLVSALAAILAEGVEAGDIRADVTGEILAVYLLGILRTRSNDFPVESGAGRSLQLALDLFLSGARTRGNGRTRGNR